MPPPFLPPAPAVFTAAGDLTVWLLERHEVPLVACAVTVPSGAASDPKGKGGLAHVTAKMLEEGAGKRGAVELARAIEGLGARLTTEANADASFVSLAVLRAHLSQAFPLFGDVVARPRLDAAEFARVKDLWVGELLEREKDPDATARVVFRVTLFGPDHPYGHPWDGSPRSARAITLDDVKRFHAAAWRPDRATLACAGDVTRAELTPLVDGAFGSWKAPATPPALPVTPAAPTGPWPKLVVVDRPDAPQSVVAMVRPGPAAASADVPPLARVNDAIGGSFTSRLNQDLREKRGLTYGAQSRFSVSRGPGMVVAWANVVTDKTGEALSAMVGNLREFATSGLTDEEVERTRSQARAVLVGAYESVESIAGHLSADASLGLGPDYEAAASRARDEAPRSQLDALAKRYYTPDGGILFVVGPRARVQPAIDALGLPPEARDAEGDVLR
jgi:predicted Zn-dependent peptidase